MGKVDQISGKKGHDLLHTFARGKERGAEEDEAGEKERGEELHETSMAQVKLKAKQWCEVS